MKLTNEERLISFRDEIEILKGKRHELLYLIALGAKSKRPSYKCRFDTVNAKLFDLTRNPIYSIT